MKPTEEINDGLLKANLILRTKSSNSENITYECILCKSKRIQEAQLFGHIESYKHHELLKRREDGDSKYTDGKYHGQCAQYSLECLLRDACNPDEFDRRVAIVLELEGYLQLQQSIPDMEGVSLELYGSSAFEAALNTSDINCFLKVKEYGLCVKTISEIVRQYSDIYTEPTVVPAHRCPRIKFTHKESSLPILLSVYSSKSDNFTELMKLFFKCDDRVLQLAKLIKYHAQEFNLLDGTFAHHIFYLMTVFFCQQTKPPLLPRCNDDYDLLMTKSEEDKSRRDERETQKREEREAKNPPKRIVERGEVRMEDVELENYAANFVMDTLRSSLFKLAHEQEINITSVKIDECLSDAGVSQAIFPTVTKENDPWESGEGAAPVTAGGWDPTPQIKRDYDWGKVGEHEKLKLSDWGDKYLATIQKQCIEWEAQNTKALHQLFQEMLRFFAKFNWDNKCISICRTKLEDKNYSFVEDPFQPGTMLYNVGNNVKNKKTGKKGGKNRVYYEMTKHMKTLFEQLRHYYESPHKKELCLTVLGNPPPPYTLPAYSPFEFAIRYKIPPPFSEQFQDPHQEKLPGLESVTDEAVRAVDNIIDKILFKFEVSPEDLAIRQRTFDDLCILVKRHLNPSIVPRWFGSSRNGLVLNTSDMDITLDVAMIEPVDPTHVLSELAQKLKENKTFILEEVILQARVPIIKFKRTDNDLSGDIAVSNLLAIRNTRLIKAYTEIDDRVKRLGFLIKAIVKECQCADASTGSLSSYAYTMMIIYFLQQVEPPVIPVLQQVNRPKDVSNFEVETWDTYFYEELQKLPSDWPTDNRDSSALLALKFFKFYYEEFDYSKLVIAPKQRELLECTDKNWFRPINIEDPFNLDHNLGKQVNSKTLDVIKCVFRMAYLRYSVGPIQRSDLSTKYYLDKNYLLDGNLPPVNFICHHCKLRGHYVNECPNKNRCSHCNEPDHQKANCPKITCFSCNGVGHMSSACPKKFNKKNSRNKGSRDKRQNTTSSEKSPPDQFDSSNWLGNTLKTRDTVLPGKHSSTSDNWRSNLRTTSESSDNKYSESRSKKKNKKRTSSETDQAEMNFIPLQEQQTAAPVPCYRGDVNLFWSDPYLTEPKAPKKTSKTLRVSTAGADKAGGGGSLRVTTGPDNKISVDKVPVEKKPEPSTHMSFMGGAVITPVPEDAKETSRQKKSKSMVRQDIFGNHKPKPLKSSNRKQTVKVKAAPPEFGSGRKATKTEVWVDPGVEEEGSRYGPKREDDFMEEIAPDFFAEPSSNFMHDPDPNDLSEWGDLTPSIAADPVMGAALQQELEPNWIDYLSSSPEKPAMKPPSSYGHDTQGSSSFTTSELQLSPTKNKASKQLLEQLHSPGRSSSGSPGKKKQGQNKKQQDPYLMNRSRNHEMVYEQDHRFPPRNTDRYRNAPTEPFRQQQQQQRNTRHDFRNDQGRTTEPDFRGDPYLHYNQRPENRKPPNSFMMNGAFDGYDNDAAMGPNFEALKRRPGGRGRGYRPSPDNRRR